MVAFMNLGRTSVNVNTDHIAEITPFLPLARVATDLIVSSCEPKFVFMNQCSNGGAQ